MLTVHTDCATTRKYRMHHVFDEHEVLQWSGPNIGPLFAHLLDAGHNQAIFDDGQQRWMVGFGPAPENS